MGVIYTVSHPFTNDIVYVGATRMLDARIKNHLNSKNKSDISEYIRQLKANYCLPKIEPIDFCDADELMDTEKFWIELLSAWGFDLLNKHRNTTKSYIKKIANKSEKVYLAKPYIKKEKHLFKKYKNAGAKNPYYTPRNNDCHWTEDRVRVGYQFTVENDRKKINSIRTMFAEYAKRFGVERHLLRSESGNNVTLTVCDGARDKKEIFGYTKGGAPRYMPLLPKKVKKPKVLKIHRFGFKNITMGQTISISKERAVSFYNSLYQYNKINEPMYFTYKTEGDMLNCTRVTSKDDKGILDKKTVIAIFLDDRKFKEIAKSFKICYSAVWSIKNRKNHKEITKDL